MILSAAQGSKPGFRRQESKPWFKICLLLRPNRRFAVAANPKSLDNSCCGRFDHVLLGGDHSRSPSGTIARFFERFRAPLHRGSGNLWIATPQPPPRPVCRVESHTLESKTCCLVRSNFLRHSRWRLLFMSLELTRFSRNTMRFRR